MPSALRVERWKCARPYVCREPLVREMLTKMMRNAFCQRSLRFFYSDAEPHRSKYQLLADRNHRRFQPGPLWANFPRNHTFAPASPPEFFWHEVKHAHSRSAGYV